MLTGKRMIALILAAALCVFSLGCLTGCGGKTESSVETNAGETADAGAAGSSEGTETAGDGEYVYQASYTPIQWEYEDVPYKMIFADGRFLAEAYTVIGTTLEEGEVEQWEGEHDVYGAILVWIDIDGSVTPLENFTPTEVPENGSVSVLETAVTSDGRIILLEEIYSSNYTGPDDVELYSEEWYEKEYYDYMTYEDEYLLRVLNSDGSEITAFPLDEIVAEATEDMGWFYPSGLVADDEGKIYICGSNWICALNSDGTKIGTTQTDDYYDDFCMLNDSTAAVSYYGENGEAVARMDLTTGTVDTENAVSAVNIYNMAVGNGEYDLLYTNGTNLMGVNLTTGQVEKILNWINCDVNMNNLDTDQIAMTEDGTIYAVEGEYDSDYQMTGCNIVTLSKVPAASVAQKEVLTFATQYLSYDLRAEIVQFNRANTEYRIEIKDYSEYNTDEDYSAGVTKLTTEILAGNVPDIIDLDGLPYEQMAAKGLLEDLYPLIDSDSELSRDDFFPNMLATLEVDGKLCRTAKQFVITTLVGASSVVGDEPGWTLEEFQAALASMPEGCEPLDSYTTRDDILSTMIAMEYNQLIDWETGECRFDSDLFIDILKFSAMFPEEIDYSSDDWSWEDEESSRIASGKQMLKTGYLSCIGDVRFAPFDFGGEATFIGYPVSEGIGSAFSFNDAGFAISSASQYKEVAWQFVREELLAENQGEDVWSFPTNRNALQTLLDEAMTPDYETDSMGEYVLDEAGNRIEQVKQSYWVSDDVTYDLYAMTQEEADELVEMIASITNVVHSDTSGSSDEITSIITEEAQAFYAGQKTAEEVARLIQSKLNIYINEQR